MKDATLSQGNRLFELILGEGNPRLFAQRLIGNWGAVQMIGRGELDQSTLKKAVGRPVNPYANEKVRPVLAYPKGYKPSSVDEQAGYLLRYLNLLDVSHVGVLARSIGAVKGADGLYLVPKPTVLAKRLGIDNYWYNFGLLTEQGPLAALDGLGTFSNWLAGQIGPDFYRLSQPAIAALKKLEAEQPGDVLVIPAQTGKLFAGYSVRNSRWEIERAVDPAQWPLPAYCVAWMLFANPHLMANSGIIDCPGDEYRFFGASTEFGSVLCFIFGGGEQYCYNKHIKDPSDNSGSASAFFG